MQFFSLGMLFANRFSFSTKFSFISLLFILTLSYTALQIYLTTSSAINVLDNEKKGLIVAQALKSSLYNDGNFEQDHETIVKEAVEQSKLNLSAQALDAVNRTNNGLNRHDHFAGVNRLNREVLAASGLKYDANKEAHFLIEIAFIQHPKLGVLLRSLNSHALFVVEQGRFTPDSYLALTDSQNQSINLLNEINQNITILDADQNQIADTLAQQTQVIKHFANFVKSNILDPDSIRVSKREITQHISDVNQAFDTMRTLSEKRITHSIETRLNQHQYTQLFAFLLLSSLGILALYALGCIAKSIRHNADKVSGYSLAVARGDLSQNLNVKTQDSLGDIGRNLDNTVTELNSKIIRIDRANQHIQSASEQVEKNVNSSLQDVQRQEEQTSLVAAASEQMATTVAEVASNAETAAHATVKASDAANKGRDFVFDTVNKIEHLASDVNNASLTINNLQAEVLKISSVLEVITSIADQTNLLALNAAIEAARAGEHGRGFAVVAEEVRALAQKTQTSTEEINTMISTLQQGAQSSVDVMENSQKGATDAVGMITQAGQMLDDIQHSIEQISEQNNQVATATEEQSMVAKDISHNSEHLKQATLQITTCIQSIVKANEGLVKDATELNGLVGEFKLKS